METENANTVIGVTATSWLFDVPFSFIRISVPPRPYPSEWTKLISNEKKKFAVATAILTTLREARQVLLPKQRVRIERLLSDTEFVAGLKNLRSKFILAAWTRLRIKPSFDGLGVIPFSRKKMGLNLPMMIEDLENRWLQELKMSRADREDYEHELQHLKTRHGLPCAWDSYLRIAVWFDKPNHAERSTPAVGIAAGDIPTGLPVKLLPPWRPVSLLDGSETTAERKYADRLMKQMKKLERLFLETSPVASRKTLRTDRRQCLRELMKICKSNMELRWEYRLRYPTDKISDGVCDKLIQSLRRESTNRST